MAASLAAVKPSGGDDGVSYPFSEPRETNLNRSLDTTRWMEFIAVSTNISLTTSFVRLGAIKALQYQTGSAPSQASTR